MFSPLLLGCWQVGQVMLVPTLPLQGASESGVVPAQDLNGSLRVFSPGSTPQLAGTRALAWLGSSVGKWQAWWMNLGQPN